MVPAVNPRQRYQSRGMRSFWKCSECRRDKKACQLRERDWENSRKKCSRCETNNWPCGPPSQAPNRKRSVKHLPTTTGPAMGSSPADDQLEQVLDLQETSSIMSNIEHGEQCYDDHAGRSSSSDQSASTVACSLCTNDQPPSVGSPAQPGHQLIETTQSEARSLDVTPLNSAARPTSSAILPSISQSSYQHQRLGVDFVQIIIYCLTFHGGLDKLTPIFYGKDDAVGNDRAGVNLHTLLQFATVKDDVEGFHTLLEFGASTRVLDRDSRSLVALAARCGSHRVIEYMLTKVFQNEMPLKGLKPPLLEAIKGRHLRIAERLVAYYSHPARYHEFKDELGEGKEEAAKMGFMDLFRQIQAVWQVNSSLCAARGHVGNLRFDPSMCQPRSHRDHGIPEQGATWTGTGHGQERRLIGAPNLMPPFSATFSPWDLGSSTILGEDMTSEALPQLTSLQMSLADKNSDDPGRSRLSTDESVLQPPGPFNFLDFLMEGEWFG